MWDVHLGLVSQHKFGEWFWEGVSWKFCNLPGHGPSWTTIDQHATKMGSSKRSLPWYCTWGLKDAHTLAKMWMWRGPSSSWICFTDCFNNRPKTSREKTVHQGLHLVEHSVWAVLLSQELCQFQWAWCTSSEEVLSCWKTCTLAFKRLLFFC